MTVLDFSLLQSLTCDEAEMAHLNGWCFRVGPSPASERNMCCGEGECNRYGYIPDPATSHLVPLFTFIYRDTFHITFAIFTIERGQVYLWELTCKVFPKPITERKSTNPLTFLCPPFLLTLWSMFMYVCLLERWISEKPQTAGGKSTKWHSVVGRDYKQESILG